MSRTETPGSVTFQLHWSADERLERNEYWSGSRMPGAVYRQEEVQPVGVALVAVGVVVVVVVAAPEGCAAADGFPVEALAARGAVVDQQAGEAVQQVIPEFVEVFDVANLLNAAASGLVGVAPVAGREHVEILAVVVDSVLFDQVAVVLAEPVARRVVAQVEQVPRRLLRAFGPFGIEHPLLVFRSPLAYPSRRARVRTTP